VTEIQWHSLNINNNNNNNKINNFCNMAPNHYKGANTASASVSCLSVSVTVVEQMSLESGFERLQRLKMSDFLRSRLLASMQRIVKANISARNCFTKHTHTDILFSNWTLVSLLTWFLLLLWCFASMLNIIWRNRHSTDILTYLLTYVCIRPQGLLHDATCRRQVRVCYKPVHLLG